MVDLGGCGCKFKGAASWPHHRHHRLSSMYQRGCALLQVVPALLRGNSGHCNLAAAQNSSINQRGGGPQSQAASPSSTLPYWKSVALPILYIAAEHHSSIYQTGREAASQGSSPLFIGDAKCGARKPSVSVAFHSFESQRNPWLLQGCRYMEGSGLHWRGWQIGGVPLGIPPSPEYNCVHHVSGMR